jgi:hypothetical protein
MPYRARQTMLDEPNATHGLHRYWRSAFTEQISDHVIDVLVDAAAGFSSPLSALLLFYMHGAAVRVPATETTFAARRLQWDFDAVGQWTDGARSAEHIAWVRALWSRMEPHLNYARLREHRSSWLARSLALAGDRLGPCSPEQLVLLAQERDDLVVLLLQPRQDRHDELRWGVRRQPLHHARHHSLLDGRPVRAASLD